MSWNELAEMMNETVQRLSPSFRKSVTDAVDRPAAHPLFRSVMDQLTLAVAILGLFLRGFSSSLRSGRLSASVGT
jgi:hypothetical protein